MNLDAFKQTKFARWIALHLLRPLAKINWCPLKALFNDGVYWNLKEEDHEELRDLLEKNYYVILVRHGCHLSTAFIWIASKFIGSEGFWAHVLMNVDNEADHNKFAFMEATGIGMNRASFMKVFDCDAAALLKPKNMTIEDYTAAIDQYVSEQGKEYDDFGDLANDKAVNCVESVRSALQKVPGYAEKFPNFEALIKKHNGQLAPQMFYDCPDFEIVWEKRR